LAEAEPLLAQVRQRESAEDIGIGGVYMQKMEPVPVIPTTS
jgi:hypothetical protein